MSPPVPRTAERAAAPAPLPLRALRAAADRVRTAPRRMLLLTVLGLGAYLLVMRLTSGTRPEQFLLCGLALALVVGGEGTRRFFLGLLPFLLYGVVYDLTHLTEPLVRYLHVHVAEPYRFDRALFGIHTAAGVLTPNEVFARHHWPAVDLVTGLAYIVFIYWVLVFAAWLGLFRRDEAGRRLLARFGWTFLLMNLVGFATYYVYPAAPPWYVAEYGFGPANMAARASPAAAIRWDELTGIHYFAAFYGRSADVFGAIPSLHASYPLLVFLYGRELRKTWYDVSTFLFFLLVCFSAVYLQHHYVLDLLVGILYALVAWAVDEALERRRPPAGAPG